MKNLEWWQAVIVLAVPALFAGVLFWIANRPYKED